MSKIIYSKLLFKMGEDFLGVQYVNRQDRIISGNSLYSQKAISYVHKIKLLFSLSTLIKNLSLTVNIRYLYPLFTFIYHT